MTEAQVIEKIKRIVPDLKKGGDFDKDDCYSKKFNTHMEIKCRTKHYDMLGIQKDKWDYLTQFKKCRFIVKTPEGMWSWNLKKLAEPVWHRRLGPTSTYYKQTQLIEECWKDIGYLDIKEATDISYLLFD